MTTVTKKSILLLRHAKSDWNIEVDDWLRPLKKRGVQAAKDRGYWMLKQGVIPDIIITSPAKRAVSTAKKVAKALGLDKQQLQQDERIYNATHELLLQLLQEQPESMTKVMLVGHNPAFETFLQALLKVAEPIPDDGKLMPTAALAVLTFTAPWSELSCGASELVSLTRIKDIQADFEG